MFPMNIQLTNHLSNRVLPFEGVYNFRDMGGYEAAGGRKVKYGLLFRSAELTGMTEHDRELFQTLSIKTIFDYRDDGEAAQKPDPSFSGVNNVRVPAMQHETSMDMRELIRTDYFKKMTPETLAEMYAKMVVDNPSFKSLMKIFAAPEHTVILHHCAGGRDRTGIGSAYLLLALGVSRETIIEDYLISNQTLVPMYEQMKIQLGEVLSSEEADDFIAALELRREFMEFVFAWIDENYGGTSAFLEQEFGLTAEKLKQLQAYYLE